MNTRADISASVIGYWTKMFGGENCPTRGKIYQFLRDFRPKLREQEGGERGFYLATRLNQC